jgi:hypothetical protein
MILFILGLSHIVMIVVSMHWNNKTIYQDTNVQVFNPWMTSIEKDQVLVTHILVLIVGTISIFF